jgi:hypothetical protein
MNEEKAEGIRAVVGDVCGRGKNRYVVAYPEEGGILLPEGATITFSLSDWEGKHEPLNGQVVLLQDVQQFKKGWRARCAKPISLVRKK